MATTDRELALGVLFKGRTDPKFAQTIRILRNLLATVVPREALTRQRQLRTGMRQTRDEMAQVGKQISKVSGGMERLTAAFKVIASYGVAGVLTYGIINSFKRGNEAIAEFDQALYNLQAIAQATTDEVTAMGNAILEVAENTKFSATETADGMVLLVQAGLDAGEAIDAIGPVADLATGTLSNLKDSADLVSTVLRAFELQASESTRVVDVMANAINRSKLTVDKLRIAFNYLGPVAHKVGLSIEDTAAASMILANAGIRASTIGTGLRQVLARLKAPTEKLREEFVAAGADLTKFEKPVLTMSEIIEELVKIVPDATRAFQLFGLRGAPAVSALTTAGVKGFRQMEEYVYRTGIASDMAATQIQGMSVILKNLKDRFEVLAIAMGEAGILRVMKLLAESLRDIVGLLIDIAKNPIGQAIIVFGSLTAVITGSTLALRYFIIVMSSFITGVRIAALKDLVRMFGLLDLSIVAAREAVQGLWAFLIGHPLFLAAAGISALVAVIYGFVSAQEKATEQLLQNRLEVDKNIKALENYRESLEKAEEGTSEYGAILARLLDTFPAEEFPELAASVDLVNKRLTDQGEALGMVKEKLQQLKIGNLVELLKKYGNELVGIKEHAKSFLEGMDIDLPIIPEEDFDKDRQRVQKHVKDLLDDIAVTWREQGWKATEGIEAIAKRLEEMFGAFTESPEGREVLTVWAKQIHEALLILEAEADNVKESFEAVASDLPPFFRTIFEQTDGILKRVEILITAKKIRTQLAQIGKEAEASQLNAAETTALMLSSEAQAWAEFIAEFYKGVKTEAQIYDERERIITSFVGRTKEVWGKYIVDTQGRIEKLEEALATTTDPKEAKKLSKQLADYYVEVWKAQSRIDAAIKTGEELRARDTVERQRKHYSELERLEQRRFEIWSKLQISAEDQEIARHEARMNRLDDLRNQELQAAKDAGKSKGERARIDSEYDALEDASEKRHTYNMLRLKWDRADKELEITRKSAQARLEEEKRALLGEVGTMREYQQKALDAETRFAEERYKVEYGRYQKIKEAFKKGSEEELEQREKLIEAWLDLEKKRTEGAENELKNRQRAFRRDSKEHLELTIRTMEEAGAIEKDLLKARLEYTREFSDEWYERFIAGIRLAHLEYKEKMEDWAQLAEATARAMHTAFSDYFFYFMKGEFDSLDDVVDNFRDALIRALADFLASKVTADFLEYWSQVAQLIASSYGGGGTTASGTTGDYDTGTSGGTLYSTHHGRRIGETTGGRRTELPSWLLALAPRLHSGLRAGEFPAILERGEEVKSKEEAGFGGRAVNVNIYTPDTKTMHEWVYGNAAIFGNVVALEMLKNKTLVTNVRRASRG